MKHYVRCRWAIHEQIIRRLERLTRHRGDSVQRVVNDVLAEYLENILGDSHATSRSRERRV